ncbi:MAG: ABC transporter substrate-binding protein [Proteobacteria bacterium]|nr:ABC transporter substrate-binding protein [Pseudomonadota bacterium]
MRVSLRKAVLAIALAAAPLGASAQTLEIATDASPSGLDPHVATAFATILVNGNLYEGLTAIDKDLRVVPSLAESWSVSPDQLTYTFKLRAGVIFHDGQTMTAKDVTASIDRVLDKATGSPIASRFNMIASSAADASGFVIKLTEPSAPFLAQLSGLAILPATHGDLARTAVGTGPFKLVEWVPDTYLRLAKHDQYWEKGLPKLAALKINIVPEASTRQVGIASGTYHMIPTLDAQTALTLKGNANVRLIQAQDLAYTLIGLNVSKPPFDNAKVREAVNVAIDRGKVVQAAYFGQGVAGGPLSPALTDWATPVDKFSCYKPDAAKAKALLKDAGIAGELAVTINVLGSIQVVKDVAQVVQAELNQAGFKASLNVQEQGKFIQDWRNSAFEAFASTNGGNVDPDDYLNRTFRTGGSTNVFKYSNAGLDKLLDDGRRTTDKAQRQKIYTEAQQVLACQGPISHVAYGTLFTAVRSNVKGYELIATRSTRYLRETSLDK